MRSVASLTAKSNRAAFAQGVAFGQAKAAMLDRQAEGREGPRLAPVGLGPPRLPRNGRCPCGCGRKVKHCPARAKE
jgi:uncharacterized protein YecA (UPF0149 family)